RGARARDHRDDGEEADSLKRQPAGEETGHTPSNAQQTGYWRFARAEAARGGAATRNPRGSTLPRKRPDGVCAAVVSVGVLRPVFHAGAVGVTAKGGPPACRSGAGSRSGRR